MKNSQSNSKKTNIKTNQTSKQNTNYEIKFEKDSYHKKFQTLQLVGQGTFGKVYKIKDKQQKLFALKIVLQDKKYKNRQLSIISQLKHFNIVGLFDHFYKYKNQDCYLNLIMEYIPQTLFTVLKRYRKQKITIDKHQIKVYAFQFFKALAYLEDLNLCHRDLKPQNILIDPNTYELKICDFGSAKILKFNQQNISYICSRFYRAPELIFGVTDYFTEIDVWSVGCMLVQFLTYQPLFPGESSVQQMIQIIKILGTPDQQYFKQSKIAEDQYINLPKIKPHSWRTVLKKFKAEQKYIDLIESTLCFDRKKRIKPADALLHPYFQDLNTQEYKFWTQKNLNLFNFKENMFKNYPKQKQLIIQRFQKKQQKFQLNLSNELTAISQQKQ